MIYNTFCGESISRLGMGNMRLPVKHEEGHPIDFEKAQEIIDYAMANGINYFDTAYVYHGGESEKFLGKALKNYPRESYKLATKFNYGANPDYKAVLKEQLEYLQTDYIDFYLLHGLGIANNWVDFRDCGCIDYFMEMKKKGVIRHLGFSFHGTVDCLREIVAHHDWDFCQLQVNYYDWLYADTKKEYEIVAEAGLPVVVMESLRGGLLASLSPEADAMLKAAHPDWSVASWALRWLQRLPNVKVMLSGMSALEQIVDNVATCKADSNTIFIYLFTALASGGAVVVSQYIGSRDKENTNRSAGQLLMSITVLGALMMTVSLIWNRQLLGLLFGGVEAAVMEAGVTYLRISACSFPFMAIYNAGAALFRSTGKTKYTMYISVTSNIINVIGNAIGIFVLHAGVAGVAYPTLIAHIFSAVVITVMCFNRERTVYYDLKDILRIDRTMINRILKVAVPNGVENGLFQLIKVALSSVTALFGTAQIAANGIAQSFWSLAALMGVAMGPAFITVIGRCMGAGDTEAARYYMNKMVRITLLSSVIWNGLIFAVTPLFMQFYPLDNEIIMLVIWLVLIHNVFNAFLFPFSGAMSNGLRAAGDVKYAMYVSVISTVAARLVLSIVFGIWFNMGVIGIALAMCCDWAVRAICVITRYKSGKWTQHKVI